MKNLTKKQLAKNFQIIHESAKESYDSSRCMIGPSPELKKKISAELKKLRSANKGLITERIGVIPQSKVGFNDGLIYPGTMYPTGTSAAVARSGAAERAPLSGTVRVAVVLVDFSDKVMTTSKSHFEDLFFSLGKISTGSVREYFREVSHGIIDIQGQVVGPYRMPKTLSQYAHGASGTGGVSPNARTMAKDAAVASNPSINFVPYDNDLDGFVDAFVVIHAGSGAEQTGSTGDIWSHKWVLEGGTPYTADGSTKIYSYLTVPEDCRLGVCAHELGHLLFGFPDLYDTDYSSEGIGNWCLMAGGSWNNGGNTPAHPSAWCKCKQNWVTMENHTTNKSNVAIEDVKSSYKVHRLWKNGASSNEYFLVENRQKNLFDKFIPNGGLLIWHIDEATANNTNETHYKVALMQADGQKDLENDNNRGDSGDCYPGSTNNIKFNNTSNPNSKSYAGSNTCVAVNNISAPAAVMHADLAVKCRIIKNKKELIIEKNRIHDKALAREKAIIHDKAVVIDKSIISEKPKDKTWVEKPTEKVGETGFGHIVGSDYSGIENLSLEERVAIIEAQLGLINNAESFIDPSLRPDLDDSALSDEESE
ncbi:MAG TPA: M6 family metalloprotease domain-containing protein [Edaphocola sp.]|nr:M6 family metalloprotease domain-containing protein [Edaphocola sp.]